MGSTPIRSGSVHDFNADASNKHQDTRSFPSSGMSAGVKDGLSSVMPLERGKPQAQQQTSGALFRQAPSEEPMGSENGKSFTFKY